MGRSGASGVEATLEPARLARADRRDALLAAAAALLAEDDAEAVSMEAVAERAGVSRPLVYKHFANRGELLGALYQREAVALHRELAAAVAAAASLEDMFRALIHGTLQVHPSRVATFTALRAAGAHDKARRDEQRRRDRDTLRYFVTQALREFELNEKQARAGIGIMLGAIDSVLAQLRLRPTGENAQLLEETYVALAMGGVRELSAR